MLRVACGLPVKLKSLEEKVLVANKCSEHRSNSSCVIYECLCFYNHDNHLKMYLVFSIFSLSVFSSFATFQDLLERPTPCFRLPRMAKKLCWGGSFGLVLDVAGEVFVARQGRGWVELGGRGRRYNNFCCDWFAACDWVVSFWFDDMRPKGIQTGRNEPARLIQAPVLFNSARVKDR